MFKQPAFEKDQLFKAGNADELFQENAQGKDIQKLAQDEAFIGQLQHGPLNKNQHTKNFEKIIIALLNNEKVIFTQVDGKHQINVNGENFDLSNILAKMNVQHLTFNTPDLNHKYMNFLNASQRKPQIPLSFDVASAHWLESKKAGALSNLEISEIAAINIYTQQYYQQMNAILRGLEHPDFKAHHPNLNSNMKEVLLHIAMSMCGLNKISDSVIKTSFRYEDDKLPAEILNERIKSVNSFPENPHLTLERGFVSTSSEKPSAGFSGPYRTVFQGLSGKNISSISYHPSEREILMNPVQVKWIFHNQYENHHYFLATAVSALNGLTTSVDGSSHDIEMAYNSVLNDFMSQLKEETQRFLKNLINQAEYIAIGDHLQARIVQCNKVLSTLDIIDKSKLLPKQKIDQCFMAINGILELIAEEDFHQKGDPSKLGSLLETIRVKYNKIIAELEKEHEKLANPLSDSEQAILNFTNKLRANGVFFEINQDHAEKLLSNSPIGSYLLRPSASNPNCLTIDFHVGPNQYNHARLSDFKLMGGFKLHNTESTFFSFEDFISRLVDGEIGKSIPFIPFKPQTASFSQKAVMQQFEDNYLRSPEGLQAIDYVFNDFLSRPYEDKLRKFCGADWDLQTPAGKVERPNHGLVHTLKVASLVPVLAQFLKKNNPAFSSLTQKQIQQAQYLMLFSVIGRQNDIGFREAAAFVTSGQYPQNMYYEFKEIGKQGFLKHVSKNMPPIFEPKDLDFWGNALDVGKPGVNTPQGILMQLAHDMDLMRCYGKAQFDEKINNLNKHLHGNMEDTLAIIDYAKALSKATGDRCMINGGFSYNREIFGQCSKNPMECLNIIDGVPKPTASLAEHPKPVVNQFNVAKNSTAANGFNPFPTVTKVAPVAQAPKALVFAKAPVFAQAPKTPVVSAPKAPVVFQAPKAVAQPHADIIPQGLENLVLKFNELNIKMKTPNLFNQPGLNKATTPKFNP